MKKIINQPDNYIKEMLEGIYIAHKDDLACSRWRLTGSCF